ncbi:hypothetical protein [Alicycliphilus denitrificans]|uniref:hypothetical protein n=1 Tax=Alicycliphilus denitrificans TaxID=179636 RepID=UPI0038512AC8
MNKEQYLKSAMLLDWIGQAPITINRAFVDLTGNVVTALWLSHAVEKALQIQSESSVLIELSSAAVEKDTGITRAQQQTCRKTLVSMGLVTEEGGQGRALKFRIHMDRLMEQLKRQAQPLADALELGYQATEQMASSSTAN